MTFCCLLSSKNSIRIIKLHAIPHTFHLGLLFSFHKIVANCFSYYFDKNSSKKSDKASKKYSDIVLGRSDGESVIGDIPYRLPLIVHSAVLLLVLLLLVLIEQLLFLLLAQTELLEVVADCILFLVSAIKCLYCLTYKNCCCCSCCQCWLSCCCYCRHRLCCSSPSS